MDEGDDPYEILGVSNLATEAEIRKAYRKLALKCHPDKVQDESKRAEATAEFAKLSAAYEILNDETERKKYDESQSGYERETQAAGGGSGKPTKKNKNAGYRKKKHKKKFNDPYEVFKRNFEESFGFAYPGAKFDNVDPEQLEKAKRLKDKDKPPEMLRLTDGGGGGEAPADHSESSSYNSGAPSSPRKNKKETVVKQLTDGSGEDNKKKSKMFRNPFKKKKDKQPEEEQQAHHNNNNAAAAASVPPPPGETSDALVVVADNEDHPKSKQSRSLIPFGRKKEKKASNAIVSADPKKPGTDIQERQPEEESEEEEEEEAPNNRPISMETKEIKIKHDDGRIETIQETVIKRPDGSIETFRMTDMPDSSSGNWQRPNQHKQLTNGESNPEATQMKQIEGGGKHPSSNLKQIGNGERLQLTDGGSSRGMIPYRGTGSSDGAAGASNSSVAPYRESGGGGGGDVIPYRNNAGGGNNRGGGGSSSSGGGGGMVPYRGTDSSGNNNNNKALANKKSGGDTRTHAQIMEEAKGMKVRELKRELQSMGVDTEQFNEKSELIQAYTNAVLKAR